MPILGILASSTVTAAGDYESIATVTVGSGGASEINFTSIPSTYQHLQIRFNARSTRNVSGSVATLVGVRVGNTTIDTGSNYAQHALGGDGASPFAGANSSVTSMPLGYISAFNATSNIFGSGIIDILDYANTNKNTTLRVLSGADLNGSGQIRLSSGLWINTAAIDAIRLFDFNGSGDFVQYSHFALYGIKSA